MARNFFKLCWHTAASQEVKNIRGGGSPKGARDRQSMQFQKAGFARPEFKFYDDLFYPAHDPTPPRPSGESAERPLFVVALRATQPGAAHQSGSGSEGTRLRGVLPSGKVVEGKKEFRTPRRDSHTLDSLAYWFMDDGHSYQNGRNRAYRFSTHSFHLKDQSLLVKVLRDNFGIHATIQKDRSYSIFSSIFSQNPLSVLVRPYGRSPPVF